MRPRGWFGPKRVGIGVRPARWQGWAVLVLYVLVLAGTGAWAVQGRIGASEVIVVAAVASAALGLVVWASYHR